MIGLTAPEERCSAPSHTAPRLMPMSRCAKRSRLRHCDHLASPHGLHTPLFASNAKGNSSLFRPRPLDEVNRRRLRLRRGVTRFIEFEGGDLTAPLSGSEVPTLWVDEQLITDIDRLHTSPLARHLQLQLALDFISGVVFEFSRQTAGGVQLDDATSLTYEDIKDSLLGRVVRFVAGSRAASEGTRAASQSLP